MTAAARVLRLHRYRGAAICRQTVADEQFLAGPDILECLYEHPSFGFDGLTVRDARVVDPSCAVAADGAVDDPTIGQPEQERVALGAELRMAAYRALPAHHRTGVLDDDLART